MSNSVYPSLPGLMFDVRRMPFFKTVRHEAASGREYRGFLMGSPRYRYTLAYDILADNGSWLDGYRTLLGFFNARKGDYDDWLFTDPDDFAANGSVFGLGDGSTTAFQLARTLGASSEPIYDLNGAPTISINGAPLVNLMAPYGGFETDSNSDGLADSMIAYQVGSPVGVGYTLAAGHSSTFCQRVYATSMANGETIGARYSPSINVVAGKSYTWAVDVLPNYGQLDPTVEIGWYDASNVNVGNSLNAIAGPGVWTRLSVTDVAPPTATKALLYVWGTSTSALSAPHLDMDNAQFEQSASPTAFNNTPMPTVSSSGLVTFGTAPASNSSLSWVGSFYWRCRFEESQLEFTKFMDKLWEARQVSFVTVKP